MSEKKSINTEESKQQAEVTATDSKESSSNDKKANKKPISSSAQVEANQNLQQAPVVIKQSSKGWSFTAILLSLLALGASGFLYVEGKNELKLANLDLAQKSNLMAVGDSENGRLLQQSLAEQQKIINQFSAIGENIRLINQRYDNTGKAYKSLTTGRLQWLIDETEYTLNIANQQLIFSGDIQSTLKTLETVEKRLNRFNQAQLLPLKKAISKDYQLIKEQSYVDVVAVSLRIDRLNSVIDTLPLFADNMLVPEESKSVVVPQKNDLTWYEDLWKSIKSSSVNLVQVRKIDNADTMLISPEQAYFLRQNIKLRFLATRIALMQHQQEIYSNELNHIKQTVNQYFDKHDQRTTVLLNEIDELLQLKLALPASNNLKHSLDTIANLRGEFGDVDEQEPLALEQPLNEPMAKAPPTEASPTEASPTEAPPTEAPPTETLPVEKPLNEATSKAVPTEPLPADAEEEKKAIEKTKGENQIPLPVEEKKTIVEERITLNNQTIIGDNQ